MGKQPMYKGPISLSSARPSDATTVRQGANLIEYETLLTDSWAGQESGRGAIFEITVPSEARSTIEGRLRQAGKRLNLGVATGERPSPVPGTLLLLVQANAKKVMAPRSAEGVAKKAVVKGLPVPHKAVS